MKKVEIAESFAQQLLLYCYPRKKDCNRKDDDFLEICLKIYQINFLIKITREIVLVFL